MSHFLEHMLFKGTPKHPKGDLDRLLARYGAQWNAFTSEDVTCYFETVPKAHYKTALELESDRMRNALISVEETEAERTVIVSEREGYENDPSFLLGEELQAIAFSRHTYGQGVIGSKDEIKLMTRDGLYAHYRRFYAPNNAYVVVTGDDEPERLIEEAADAFGPLDPSTDLGEPPKSPEPEQHGERRVIVHRAGGTLPIVMLGVPRAARDRSARRRDLRADGRARGDVDRQRRRLRPLLAPASRAGRDGARRGRRCVVPAHEGSVSVLRRRDAAPGHQARRRRARPARGARRSCRSDLLAEDEFARVRRQLLAATAFNTDTITWRAYRCGQLLSTGAATSISEWYAKLAAVTREEIRDAAAGLFVERSRNVGWFVPEGDAS